MLQNVKGFYKIRHDTSFKLYTSSISVTIIFIWHNEFYLGRLGKYTLEVHPQYTGPPGVFGIWGEGIFIFRELGALLFILGELGSKHILLGI